jgi:hypothetical protein
MCSNRMTKKTVLLSERDSQDETDQSNNILTP